MRKKKHVENEPEEKENMLEEIYKFRKGLKELGVAEVTSTVYTPIISDKNDIVKLALDNNIPLQYVRSCYQNGEKHCGKCESCTRLKNALIHNHDTYFIRELF